MKNIKYLVLAVLLIITMGFVSSVHADPTDATASSACVSLSTNLKYRSTDAKTNGDVSTLQDFLQTGGYLSIDPTGYFNLATKKAVRSFQLANGLTSDGSVGPITRAKLNALYGCGGPIPSTALTPANVNLTPVNGCSTGTYVACTSNANACGQTAGGYKLCGTNTCGVAIPSEALCPAKISVPLCVITNFTATPSAVTAGQVSRLSWKLSDACYSYRMILSNPTYIELNPGVSYFDVSPTTTTKYDLEGQYGGCAAVVTGAGVVSGCGNPEPKSVTITVNPVSISACTITNFTATPSTITAGQSTTLRWTSSNCNHLNIYTSGVVITNSTMSIGDVTIFPTTTTTYTLSPFSDTPNADMSLTTTGVRNVIVTVGVNPDRSVTSAPLITGLQGVSTTGVYTNWSGVAGQSVAIYGTFATSGNTVKIGDDTYTPTYQSATQLNVLLSSTLSTGQKKVTVTNTNGTSNSPSINIVSTIPVVSATPMPVITGIQGYPGYTTGTAVAGQYVVLYGTFTATGNTVTIGSQIYTPTYQGTTQINVNIGSALGPLSVSVTNPNGTSNSVVVTVASASITTPPPANTGGSSASVTCPSGTPVGTAIPCTSTANSCGKTNAGYVQCGIPNVSCSATTPIENLCTAPATPGNHWACVTNAAFGLRSTMCQDASGNVAAYNSCGTPINACQ
jgi:hypothetical protein